MKQLRTIPMLIAVVVSGLAVVAVAPAPPAAADLYTILSQGSIAVEQGNNTAKCASPEGNFQSGERWYRRFDLGDEGVLGSFTPELVRFGVESVTTAIGHEYVPVRVRVYPFPAEDPLTSEDLDAMTDYLEASAELTDTLPDDHLVEVKPTAANGFSGEFDPATYDAVVEIAYDGHVDGEWFTFGTNDDEEDAPAGYFTFGPLCHDDDHDYDGIADHVEAINPVIQLEGVEKGRSDQDGDGVLEPDEDACPLYKGPTPRIDPPGCPVFSQTVSATYRPATDSVTGNVSGGADGVCQDQVDVTIYDVSTGMPLDTTQTAGPLAAMRGAPWARWWARR